jgi:L-alanine-DL-glutamate epimerase-like enolase superfamily enzyme
MADESCKRLTDIPKCARYFHMINLKLTKTGGLTEAIRMIHAARAHDLKIMLGCFTETNVSISAMASISPLVDFTDLDGALLLAKDPYANDLFKRNEIHLHDKVGLGIEI